MRNRIWIVWGLVAAGCLEQGRPPGGESGFPFTVGDAGVPAHPNAGSSRAADEGRRPSTPRKAPKQIDEDASASAPGRERAAQAGEGGASAPMPGAASASGASAPRPAGATAGSPAPGSVAYGALVITEWMADPMARSDAEGEWVELYNASKASIDLANCAIGDGAGTPHALSDHVALAPGEYATIASSQAPGFSASTTVALALKNSADVIELHCGDVLIDRVAYDQAEAFPVVAGAAAALDPRALDADKNDVSSAWCSASEIYAQDRGTPGAANPACAGQSSAAPGSETTRPTKSSTTSTASTKSKAPESDQAASAPRLAAGAVLISELMTDPRERSDADGEWIELYNATGEAIDLAGCAIADGSASPHAISEPLRIDSKAFATVASGMDPGFRPSLASALSLNNSADIVELRCGDVVVDRVAYDRAQGFPLEAGASMALAPGSLSAQSNDSASEWCLATDAYGTDRGTPGKSNPPCQPKTEEGGAPSPSPAADSAPTWPVPDSAAAAEPTVPSLAYGAVVITEIMPDPDALSDSRGEWIELYNSTSAAIDLAGCAIGDGTAQARAFSEALRIDSGSYATLAAASDPGFNATGVTALALRNDTDAIELRCGDVLIDRVAYDRSQGFPTAAGASASLDPSKLSADDNDAPSAWCVSTHEYAIDRGTPGAPNPPCAVQAPDPAGPDPDPQPESEPEAPTDPDPDPPPTPESESQPEEPAPDADSDSPSQPEEPAPEAKPESGPQAEESAPEAEPESESQAEEPAPEAEPESESQAEESAPEAEPESESQAEEPAPEAEPESAAEPESQPVDPEPAPSGESASQPADPEPQPAPDAEPQPVEPDPEPAPHPEPQPESNA